MPGLVKEDFRTPVWGRLTETLHDRLQRLRELNDDESSPEKTARIRGQIREVKRLINLHTELETGEHHPEQA